MNETSLLGLITAAFMLGLMSSGHCLGMCGGISAAFGISRSQHSSAQRFIRLLTYNAGRVSCYALLGLAAGWGGEFFFKQFQSLMLPLRLIAGLMLIAMACYLSQWWMGILVFERIGQWLWKFIQPLSLRLLPQQHLSHVFFFGVLWGFLPCGLVYSMLLWLGSNGHAVAAILGMIAFGLGTLPALLVSGYSAAQLRKILQHKNVRLVSSLLLLLFALWTIGSALYHSSHHHQH